LQQTRVCLLVLARKPDVPAERAVMIDA
jgi:hypothetical protein